MRCRNVAGETRTQLSQQAAFKAGLGVGRVFFLSGGGTAAHKMGKFVNVGRLLGDQQAECDEEKLQRALQSQPPCETGSASTIR